MAVQSFSDLPVDVFLLICGYLDGASFVHLTSTCKSLHSTFANEPSIWSSLVRETFRVANQPVVEHDGARWRKLFRRLKTETHAYTWGDNGNHRLGQTARIRNLARQVPARNRHRPPLISWPEEMEVDEDVGVISDMQCGGWSTSVLSSKGILRVVGVIDGLDFIRQVASPNMTVLTYPSSHVSPQDAYNATTAIKQYSQGRQHILALSDSGRIWSWSNAQSPALQEKFLDYDTIENKTSGRGTVRKVVAGWSKAAALVDGSGIIVWQPSSRAAIEDDDSMVDTLLVTETALVPETNAISTEHKAVKNFIVLEAMILFVTVEGRVYASSILWDELPRSMSQPQELSIPSADGKALDVQGSFRSFVVFTKNGAVLTSTQERLKDHLNGREHQQSPADVPELFDRIPALQNAQVIALAFGDYHFHALHASGYITSYGQEPRCCGCLGLGSNSPEARLRGIRQHLTRGYQAFTGTGNGRLVHHAYNQGRRVWFEREKRDWIKFMASGGADPVEAADRVRMALGSPQVDAQGEVSEWIEQEGRDWEDKYNAREEGDDGLPAYFALSVAAGGWHSGALMLVNTRLVAAIKSAVEQPEETLQEDLSADVADTSYGDNTTSWFQWVWSLGRSFLGLSAHRPIDRPAEPQPAAPPAVDRQADRVDDPISYGAAPRAGMQYIWSKQSFPRLRLTDGTEMPGTVPFNEWRYGRPEWRAVQALSTAGESLGMWT